LKEGMPQALVLLFATALLIVVLFVLNDSNEAPATEATATVVADAGTEATDTPASSAAEATDGAVEATEEATEEATTEAMTGAEATEEATAEETEAVATATITSLPTVTATSVDETPATETPQPPTGTPAPSLTPRDTATPLPTLTVEATSTPPPPPPTQAPTETPEPTATVEPTVTVEPTREIEEGQMVQVVLIPGVDLSNEILDAAPDAADAIAARLEALGVEDAIVTAKGDGSILIEMADRVDLETLLDDITSPAELQVIDISGVEDPNALIGQLVVATGSDVIGADEGILNPATDDPFETIVVADVVEAEARVNTFNEWLLDLVLDDASGRTLTQFTGQRVGERIAVVIDGTVVAVPRVGTTVGTEIVIQSDLTEAEANALAALLTSDGLPYPIEVESIAVLQAD
jgi:hypothetical protein